MTFTCEKCGAEASAPETRAYCEKCIEAYKAQRQRISENQNPRPGMHLDGQFVKPKECPSSIYCEEKKVNVCGLCGSTDIHPGYGLGSGYGMGTYNFCMGCDTFLDFSEDIE